MSYIKVSNEQHDRVKSSMKHTGNSIRSRSLNNVLGSIDALNVQPFERFEEERSNIHNYWLKLANGDIPGYVAAWKSRQLQRQQVTWSLGEEIKVKLEHVEVNEDKEEECHSHDKVMEPSSENNCLEVLPVEEVSKEQQSYSLIEEDLMDDTEAIHEMTTDLEDVNGKKDDYVFEEQKHDDTDATEEDDEVMEHVQEDCNENQHNAPSLNDSATMVSDMIEPPTKSIFLQVEQDQQQLPPLCPISNNPQVINNPVEMQQSHCSSASAKTEGEDASPIVSEYRHSPGNVDISVSQVRHGGVMFGQQQLKFIMVLIINPRLKSCRRLGIHSLYRSSSSQYKIKCLIWNQTGIRIMCCTENLMTCLSSILTLTLLLKTEMDYSNL